MEYDALSIVRKLKLTKFIIYTFFIALLVFAVFTKNLLIIFFAAFLFVAFPNYLWGYVFNHRLNKIFRAGDYSLAIEVFNIGKYYYPASIMYVSTEFHLGDYKTIVNKCTALLKTGTHKEHKYWHYYLLANSFFITGNRDYLGEVVKAYFQSLDGEKQKIKGHYLTYKKTMELYRSFAAGDIGMCFALLNNANNNGSAATMAIDTVYRAILHLETGDTEEAQKLCEETIRQNVRKNSTDLARHVLSAIQKGIPYKDTFGDLTPDINYVIPEADPVTKAQRALKKPLRIIKTVIAVILVLGMYYTAIDYGYFNTYTEEIRTMVEDDYDGVKILANLSPKTDNGDVTDSMFLAKTNNEIILASSYGYEGMDELFYDVKYSIPLSDLDSYREIVTFKIDSTVGYFKISGYFLYDSPIPEANKDAYSVTVTVNGRPLHLVFTNVIGKLR